MNAAAEHWNGPIREHPDDDGRMSVKSLLGAALGVLVSLALLASAGFFYVAIQRDEMVTAQCMSAVNSIRSTQMLAAQWSIEVGKVKNEVNSNFDVLANFVDRMSPHIRVIHDSQSAMPNLPSDIKWALNGYVQRLKAREERIERFKSGFAIVRNSRRIIPREGALLAEAARDGGHRRVEAATRQILEWMPSFLRQPTEIQHQRLAQAASTLDRERRRHPLAHSGRDVEQARERAAAAPRTDGAALRRCHAYGSGRSGRAGHRPAGCGPPAEPDEAALLRLWVLGVAGARRVLLGRPDRPVVGPGAGKERPRPGRRKRPRREGLRHPGAWTWRWPPRVVPDYRWKMSRDRRAPARGSARCNPGRLSTRDAGRRRAPRSGRGRLRPWRNA